MQKKEYTFQCIISYEAENEEKAREILQDDLKVNGISLFDCVKETETERVKKHLLKVAEDSFNSGEIIDAIKHL